MRWPTGFRGDIILVLATLATAGVVAFGAAYVAGGPRAAYFAPAAPSGCECCGWVRVDVPRPTPAPWGSS